MLSGLWSRRQPSMFVLYLFDKESAAMPAIILWLLGVPITVIILLYLVGILG